MLASLSSKHDESQIRPRGNPLRIYPVGNCSRRYTPDFLVRTAAAWLVYEVKPADKATAPDTAALMAAAADHYAGRGMHHQVVTENEIRVRPYLDNVVLLLRYQRHTIAPELEVLTRRLVGDRPLQLGQLADELAPAGGVADALCLLANHRLWADLTLPLNRTSWVQLFREG